MLLKLSDPSAVEFRGFSIVQGIGNRVLNIELISVSSLPPPGGDFSKAQFLICKTDYHNLISWRCGITCTQLSAHLAQRIIFVLLDLLTWLCVVGRICCSVFGIPLNYYLQTPHASTAHEAELTSPPLSVDPQKQV